MRSVRALVVTALLALSSVDAKKHKVHVSKWANSQCDGHPLGGKQFELKKDDCHTFSGGSIRIQQHHKKKYNKWINSDDRCSVDVYSNTGCADDQVITRIPVPMNFERCTVLDGRAGSFQFTCDSDHGWKHQVYNTTTVLPMTYYSIDNEGRAHPTPYSKTMTTSGTSLASYNLAARAEPTGNATVEARGKKQHNVKGLWSKHPWSGSDICYKCWTKKELNFGKLECRSGPKHYIDCGPKPAHVPVSSVATSTATRTVEYYFTRTNQTMEQPTAMTTTIPELEKRSRHRAVIVENPYMPGQMMCADAEWENEGKPNKQEIRLQKFKKVEKCEDKNAIHLDFYHPQTTTTAVSYATATIVVDNPTWAPTP